MNIHVMQALHQLLGSVKSSQQPLKHYEDGSSGNIAQGHLQQRQPYPQQRVWEDGSGINLGLLSRGQMSLGTADGGNPQNTGPQQLQGLGRPLDVLPQGGRYNPGLIPLQQSNIRYRQGPQPTQPWYDF